MISGFLPENDAERSTVRDLDAEHGFNPLLEPHRLTPNRPTDPHDAKRVGASLLPEGLLGARGERCWRDTPLCDLESRGAI